MRARGNAGSRTSFLIQAAGASLFTGLLFAASAAVAGPCTQTAIRTPVPLTGNKGEVFQLTDGSWWRITAGATRLSANQPIVWICDSPHELVVRGETLTVEPLTSNSQKRPAEAAVAIETRIAGQFNGWDGHTRFLLENGQIWQQASYSYHYAFAQRPRVRITQIADRLKMEIEGISEAIYVKRLK